MHSVLRCSFSRSENRVEPAGFLSWSRESYNSFLFGDGASAGFSIKSVLETFFHVSDLYGYASVDYIGYELEEPVLSIEECKLKMLSYAAKCYVNVRLTLYDIDEKTNKRSVRIIKEEKVYLCDFPLMIGDGIFIINGIEKVVISQIKRAPGVFFKKKAMSLGKINYIADIRPYFGSRVEFQLGGTGFFCKVGTFKKIKVYNFLRSLGATNEEIIQNVFSGISLVRESGDKFSFDFDFSKSLNKVFYLNVRDEKGEIVFNAGEIITKFSLKKVFTKKLYCNVNDLLDSYIFSYSSKNSKIKFDVCQLITEPDLDNILGVDKITILDRGASNYSDAFLKDIISSASISEEDAVTDVMSVFRGSVPVVFDEASKYIKDFFFSQDRFNLMEFGRKRLNEVLGVNLPEDFLTLGMDDIFGTIRSLFCYEKGDMYVMDTDDLSNRRISLVGEIVCDNFRDCIRRLVRSVFDKLNGVVLDNVRPSSFIPSNIVAKPIKDFFLLSDLCQFMEQNNLLSEITHIRKITALGEGGILKDAATTEVRDVHGSHYGRVCPIETPDGQNIGLVISLACYARINKYGFVEAPYRRIVNGKIDYSDIVYLDSLSEKQYKIGYARDFLQNQNNPDAIVSIRYNNDFMLGKVSEIEFVDLDTCQITSMMSSFIPFIESNDIARALMGCNMQRQAVPLLFKEAPFVATGMEKFVGRISSSSIKSNIDGEVAYVDANAILVKNNSGEVDKYLLKSFDRSNQDTLVDNVAVVRVGDKVKKGDILADCASTSNGEVSVGKNILLGFLPWNGYNYEDSVVVSQRLVADDKFTSIHIKEFEVLVRDTVLGTEETTNNIDGVPIEKLQYLDESGVICIGTNVTGGDILVGKVSPCAEKYSSSEDRLLTAMFSYDVSNKKDTSLYVPSDVSGVVIGVDILTRRGSEKDDRALQIEKEKIEKRKKLFDLENEVLDSAYAGNTKSKNYQAAKAKMADIFRQDVEKIMDGDLLPSGVLKIVKVFVAIKSRLQPGDKIAGRHGNKGVISRCVAVEDMPYLEDGTPLDLLFSPVSIPGRMNIGQVLETHLGFLCYSLGKKIDEALEKNEATDNVRKLLKSISTCDEGFEKDIDSMSDKEVIEFADEHRRGVHVETPIFDGAKISDMETIADRLGIDKSLQVTLYDGMTGEPFDRKVTVGYMYIIKLHHLVDEKIHARSTGPYSLVTQQPIGGRSCGGGQRFGEMECWALQAYGAAFSLQEMLTLKSDDINGREKMYNSLIDGASRFVSGVPESFNVLCREFRSLGFDVELGLM